jgi:hypothetical protein
MSEINIQITKPQKSNNPQISILKIPNVGIEIEFSMIGIYL